MNLFTVLHEIVFYGKGGYDFDTVYNMPIWLRTFVYNNIHKHYEEESRQVEKANKGKGSKSLEAPKMPQVRQPDVSVKTR